MPVTQKVLLLVENDAAAALKRSRELEGAEYHVIHTSGGADALEYLSRTGGAADLILMDLDPEAGSDGASAARDILERYQLPLIFLTSHTEPSIVEKTASLHSYGIVLKDSGSAMLLASIRTAFRLYEAQQFGREKDLELKESEFRFATVFANTAIGMSLTDVTGRLLKVNHAFAEMVGRSPEALHSIDFNSITHPDDRALGSEHVRALLQPGSKVARFMKRYIHSDGHIIWADLTTVLLRSASGEPMFFISQIQDITEHKKAEDLLREQEFWLRECQRIGRIGSYDLDIGKNSWTSSAVLDEIFGIPEGCDKTIEIWNTIVHPSQREEMMEYFLNSVVGNRNTFDKEYRIVRISDGIERWVWGRGELICNGEGIPLHMIGTIQDITERKNAETALRESEIRFKEIFDKAPLGYHELDAEGRIIRVNSTEAAMLGYTQEEMVGKYAWSFIEEEERSRLACLKKLRGESEPGQGFERKFRRKDGTLLYVLLDDLIIRNDEGTIIGIRTALQDITDRKRLEQQLLQSQKLEGVGTLAGGIAHDFNNLLAVILGSAELLRLHTADIPEINKYVDHIVSASERGKSISRQLLIFSRPDQAELKPISLSHTITELQSLLEHFLPKSISIRTSIEIDNGIIMGDAGQIHQALLNLALNAGDAMTNSGTLMIKEYSVPPEFMKHRFGDQSSVPYVAVCVSDTGRGMEPALIEKIFTPFFSTKERGKGTGLGLAIVHGIMKNHRGFIDVESTPGSGTTFTLFFPLAPMPPKERCGTDVRPQENHTENILIVDDEELLRETLSEFLSEVGYHVHTAVNGVEALKYFEENHDSISLVVTDLGMPEMGGEELFRRIRKIDAKAKVMVSSGYLDGTTKHDLLSMGFVSVLTKPFMLKEIRESIRKTLADQPSA
ncbi:MAG: PAS domain S-box protein [Acidobacteriota bacterium]